MKPENQKRIEAFLTRQGPEEFWKLGNGAVIYCRDMATEFPIVGYQQGQAIYLFEITETTEQDTRDIISAYRFAGNA